MYFNRYYLKSSQCATCFEHMSRLICLFPVKSPLKFNRSRRLYSLDIQTNVAEDVLLYKSTSSRFFRVTNFFVISQFAFWTYMSSLCLTLRDIPVPEDKSQLRWWEKYNLGDPKTKTMLSFGCIGICKSNDNSLIRQKF